MDAAGCHAHLLVKSPRNLTNAASADTAQLPAVAVAACSSFPLACCFVAACGYLLSATLCPGLDEELLPFTPRLPSFLHHQHVYSTPPAPQASCTAWRPLTRCPPRCSSGHGSHRCGLLTSSMSTGRCLPARISLLWWPGALGRLDRHSAARTRVAHSRCHQWAYCNASGIHTLHLCASTQRGLPAEGVLPPSPRCSGTAVTDEAHDWTVTVDATGLQPASRYFYRFASGKLRR